MLCCLLAALAASPLLWWPAMRRPDGGGVRVLPIALAGFALMGSVGLFCLVVFTTPGAAAFRHFCSAAGWIVRPD